MALVRLNEEQMKAYVLATINELMGEVKENTNIISSNVSFTIGPLGVDDSLLLLWLFPGEAS
jgi:hypothetical protein